MTRGALLTLSLLLSHTVIAQSLSYDDILALNPETAPARAALSQSRPVRHSIEPIIAMARYEQWGYSGEQAPPYWHTLHSDYAACSGENQSPIDIKATFDTELEPIAFHYEPPAQRASNDGNTIRFSFAAGKHIVVDSKVFFLREMDLHAPSENRINGESYPLEVQLTHESLDGEIAVVAFMASAGETYPAFDVLLQAVPSLSDGITTTARPIEPATLLPKQQDYYRFNGSLTTPPCTEGVRWFVMKEPVQLSTAQLNAVSSTLTHANNRPIQALNARLVLE